MSDTSLKIADLLPQHATVDLAELRLGAGATAPNAQGFIAQKLGQAIGSALDVDVLGLVAEAWAKTDALRELATGSGAAEEQHLYLAKHDVVCENRLDVVLEFAGAPAVTDHLKLVLTAKFEGAGLTVDGGCIVAIDAGRGAAKAELRYANAKLLSGTSDWVTLPAECRLAHPVHIVARREAEVVPLRPDARGIRR